MLLYDSATPAPNPRRVKILLAEKRVEIPKKALSLVDREQKEPQYLRINPLGKVPSLVLDDGTVLTESLAICRYFESVYPKPPLFGVDPLNCAEVEMWTRRVEHIFGRAVSMIWLHSHPFNANTVKPQYKEFGESQRRAALDALAQLDQWLKGRDWLDCRAFTIADIVLLTQIDFAAFLGLEPPDKLNNLIKWYDRASARPSVNAS